MKNNLNTTEPGISSVIAAIQKSLLALTDSKILIRIIIPFIASMLLGLILLILFWSDVTGLLTLSLKSIGWLSKVLAWIFTSLGGDGTSFYNFLSGSLFIFFVGVGIYVITVLLTSTVLIPMLIPVIISKHYPHLSVSKNSNLLASLYNSLKASLVFAILFIFSLPLLLIPGAAVIISLFLNAYLTQKVFPFDILQDFASKDEIIIFQMKYKIRLWILALSTGVLVYIPFVNFLAPSITALSFIFYIFDCIVYAQQQNARTQ